MLLCRSDDRSDAWSNSSSVTVTNCGANFCANCGSNRGANRNANCCANRGAIFCSDARAHCCTDAVADEFRRNCAPDALTDVGTHTCAYASNAGAHRNVLKVRPPLVFNRAHADEFFAAFETALSASTH